MSTVISELPLPIPVEKAWELIGNFNALPEWHPAVDKSELEAEGTIRRLYLVGGGEIVEKLEAQEDGSYSYTIVNSPLPVMNYHSTLRVMPDGDGCKVVWSGDFEANGVKASEAESAVLGIYQQGFDNLKRVFGL